MFESLQHIDEQLLLLFNGSNSAVMDTLAMTETSRFAWFPFIVTTIYVLIKNNNVKKCLLLMTCLSVLYILSSVFVSGFIQPSIARLRPAVDLNFTHMVDMVNQTTGGIHGMFSHHASKLMAFGLFFVLLFRDWTYTFYAGLWILLHSWVLLYLGYYYPFDIFAGFIWGAVLALLAYLVYMKVRFIWFNEYEMNSDRYTSGGYLYEDLGVLNFVFLLNLLGIILVSLIRY